jgi:hypothetical protein
MVYQLQVPELKQTEKSWEQDRSWARKVRKGFKALVLMENHKNKGPWLSNSFRQLQQVLKHKYFETERESEGSLENDISDVSFTFANTARDNSVKNSVKTESDPPEKP